MEPISTNSSSSKQQLIKLLKKLTPWRNSDEKHHSAPSTRMPKIGLALSSGGAKSLAHIGVLEVFEEHNIPIHAIAGSSMGAYVGALWATGHNAAAMRELAEEMQDPLTMKRLADPVMPPLKGLFYGNKVKAHLARSIGDQHFEDLQRKLLVISANLDTYERIVFRRGKLVDAVHASCAMPGIIVPVELDGVRCTDGGVVDPVPVGALKKFTDVDHVIAISTVPRLQDIDTHDTATLTIREDDQSEAQSWWQKALASINPGAPGNMVDNLRRALRASQIRLAHDACLRASVAIYPVAEHADWHAYHQYEEFIRIGREEALKALPRVQQLLTPIPETPHDSRPNQLVVATR
ncbi:patatin-like phospholipase family protein [Rubritalea marina]|uniref:patatin-like phospholipase family protein n=1 Tax=Rubritalea marina TaxID=361055 RepID=UPI000367335B|nr:patatin-like phospholipase family protein [Rubritalea marina]